MQEFLKEWLPRGSDWYYSLLSVNALQRQTIAALHAYSSTLHHTAERYTEPSMAELKLQWWQQEIERAFQDHAEHPIGQMLQPGIKEYQLSKTALLAIQESALLSLRTQRFETAAELAQHYQHTGGIVQALIAQVLHQVPLNEKMQQYAHTLGVGLETIRHIIDAPYYFARQHLYFPTRLLTEYAVDVATMLQNPIHCTVLQKVFKAQADEARQCCAHALALLPTEAFITQRPGRVYTALKLKQLTAIEQDGFRVFQHRLEVSPLQKWWVSIVTRA